MDASCWSLALNSVDCSRSDDSRDSLSAAGVASAAGTTGTSATTLAALGSLAALATLGSLGALATLGAAVFSTTTTGTEVADSAAGLVVFFVGAIILYLGDYLLSRFWSLNIYL